MIRLLKYGFGGKWLKSLIRPNKYTEISEIIKTTKDLPYKTPIRFDYKKIKYKSSDKLPLPIKNETSYVYELASKPLYYSVDRDGNVVSGRVKNPLDESGYPAYNTHLEAMVNYIQDNYVEAMSRRRPDYFYWGVGDKFYEGAKAIKDPHSNSFIIDAPQYRPEIFHVTHFSPETLRGGLRTIDLAAVSKQPIMFTVTDDLAPMLLKRGFVDVLQVPLPFGGELVNKHVMLNKGCLNNKEALLKSLESEGLPEELGNSIIKKLEAAPDVSLTDRFITENKLYFTNSPIHNFNILELIKLK